MKQHKGVQELDTGLEDSTWDRRHKDICRLWYAALSIKLLIISVLLSNINFHI